jgi:hypothetical protein
MASHDHPIYQLLQAAAAGHPPTSGDLEDLDWNGADLPADVKVAAARVLERWEAGDYGAARATATDESRRLIAKWRSPEPTDDDWPSDPRAAAARIPRWGGART